MGANCEKKTNPHAISDFRPADVPAVMKSIAEGLDELNLSAPVKDSIRGLLNEVLIKKELLKSLVPYHTKLFFTALDNGLI